MVAGGAGSTVSSAGKAAEVEERAAAAAEVEVAAVEEVAVVVVEAAAAAVSALVEAEPGAEEGARSELEAAGRCETWTGMLAEVHREVSVRQGLRTPRNFSS